MKRHDDFMLMIGVAVLGGVVDAGATPGAAENSETGVERDGRDTMLAAAEQAEPGSDGDLFRQGADANTLTSSVGFPGSRRPGTPVFPVEDVLRNISRATGFSFIFESKLVKGKLMSPVDQSARTEDAIRTRLQSVDLSLHRLNKRSFAITAAAAAPVERAISALAPAVAAKTPLMDAIIVTGTRVAHLAETGGQTLFVLDQETLAYHDVLSPDETIFDLPQTLASVTSANTALFGSVAGLNLADLRGLGALRTQTLINGRRTTLTAGGNGDIIGFDLNSLAQPFLERIEVEAGPTSARRGANGVGGAINFVLRTDVDGLEGGVRLGIAEEGDAEQLSAHVLGGRSFAQGAVRASIGVNLTRSEGLIGADRDETSSPYGFSLDGRLSNAPEAVFTPGFGGARITDVGAITGVLLNDGTIAFPPGAFSLIPTADGQVETFEGRVDQLFNWSAALNTVVPLDRGHAFAAVEVDASPNITFHSLLRGGTTSTNTTLAPLPATRFTGADRLTGDALVIPLSNPTLPEGIRNTITDGFDGAATAIVFDHRFTELGPRRQSVDRNYIDLNIGADVDYNDYGHASFAYRFGRTRTTSRSFDRINRFNLLTALGAPPCDPLTACNVTISDEAVSVPVIRVPPPSDPPDFLSSPFPDGGLNFAAQATASVAANCQSIPSCVPIDLFSGVAIPEDALAFIRAPAVERQFSITEHELSGAWNVDQILDSPWAPQNIRTGLSALWTNFVDADSAPVDIDIIGAFEPTAAAGDIFTADLSAGFDLTPLQERNRFISDLTFSLDTRWTVSPQHDPAHNIEAAVEWRPFSGVTLFSRHHFGERPPSVVELFSVGDTFFGFVGDPCGDPAGFPDGALRENCLSPGEFGVPIDFIQDFSLARRTFFGNPELEPENIRTDIAGISLRPSDWFSAESLRVDIGATWFDYRVTNGINSVSLPAAACFQSIGFSSAECGLNPATGQSIIERDPISRQITSVDSVLRNGSEFFWRGVDAEFRTVFAPEATSLFDRVWVSAYHTYTEKVLTTDLDGFSTDQLGLTPYPRHQSLISIGAERGKWGVGAFITRRGAVETVRDGRDETQIPAFVYADVSLRYNVSDELYLQLGIDNIADKAPPIVPFASVGSNSFPQFYDIIGRRYAVQARFRF